MSHQGNHIDGWFKLSQFFQELKEVLFLHERADRIREVAVSFQGPGYHAAGRRENVAEVKAIERGKNRIPGTQEIQDHETPPGLQQPEDFEETGFRILEISYAVGHERGVE